MADELPLPSIETALAIAPAMQKLQETVAAMLPAGTHFGIFVDMPGEIPGTRQMAVVTTDREYMVAGVARWVLSTLEAIKERSDGQ